MQINQIDRYTGMMPVADIQSITKETTAALDMPHFTYDHINSQDERLILSNAPEWINAYFKEKHHLTKRMKTESLCEGLHFIDWTDLHDFGIVKARHDFHIPYGFTILSNGSDGQEMFHFGCDNESYDAEYYRCQMGFLKSFILNFRSNAKSLKQQMPRLSFRDAPKDYRFGHNIKISDLLKESEIKRCYLNEGELYLTCREAQVIQYLAQGKNTVEIAIILRVSKRTLESHIINLKMKFNCSTLFQLALKIKQFDSLSLF